MEKLLRPDRFEADQNSPTAAKEWSHWKKLFQNYIAEAKLKEEDKLKVLINFLSHSVYDHISDCKDFSDAIKILDGIYIKPKNEIFARHLLATKKQLTSESIDQYLQSLKILAKECTFKAVSPSQYKDEYIRDAFINGIMSNSIRQRLLENDELSLERAVMQSRALEMAQKQSEAYSMPVESINHVNTEAEDEQSESMIAAIRQKCFFLRKTQNSNKSNTTTSAFIANLACISANLPGALSKTVIKVRVNDMEANGLVDTGGSSSFIDDEFVQYHKIKVFPKKGQVVLASAEHSSHLKGFVCVDLSLQGHVYKDVKLSVLSKLCTDVLIGHDILQKHSKVEVTFGGPKSPLLICNMSSTAIEPNVIKPMPSFVIEPPRLFKNLASNCKPIAVKLRQYSEEDYTFIKDEIIKLLNENVIEESMSPWRAQVLVTKTENHKKRMVIDYSQTINRFTMLDAYPLPIINDLVSKVAQYSIYSTIDLHNAYHQIPIHEEERDYTAFEAAGRLYHFRKIPFGVTNGVACFQRVMDKIISNENLNGVYAYLDDITICGKNQSEHDLNLNKFLNAMKNYGLILNENKCQYSMQTITLLGHQITNKSVSPDPDRLKPLLNLPPPKDAKSLKRVLGMFSHYSKWVRKFSDKIHNLILCKSFPMSSSAIADFESIKLDIANSVISSISGDEPLVVESDASNHALAATLSQNGRPIAFFSRSLSNCEKKHPSIEKEAYAIVEALRKWRHFLIGRQFKLITDQEAVSFMFNLKHSSKIKNDKIIRWRLELSCFSFDIQYRPGKENTVADTFSRVCAVVNNSNMLSDLHKSLCHPGVTRMFHWIKSKNLPFSIEDIKKLTSSCNVCAEVKPRFYKKQEGHLIKATSPFERLNIDFKGPIPSKTGNNYILTIVDEFSRFPFAIPCRDLSSATVIKCLSYLFSIFGMPAYIHSDRGAAFLSQELTTFLCTRGIATSRTTPYNPAGNGQVERYNGIIWKTVQLAIKTRGLKLEQWEAVIADALHSIRSLLCTATNCTPHERFFAHPRRSSNGGTLPSWLSCPGKVFIKKHVRASKYEPLVEEVDLVEVNPEYALVRYENGRESNVSLRDLAPVGDRTLYEEPSDRIDPKTTLQDTPTTSEPKEEMIQTDASTEGTSNELDGPRRTTRNKSTPKYLKDYVTN
ncbi:unnamed protein product [Macrosiphum euphorbiae]|uniref:RNA-directed DNA polymerase n=1 Tax=Macrosiphum euphorbiae TaxID=13131 RepID=A0AAV0XYT9_9HEMI|nr:unnamed protein product [Macrosiphum euphorbiae]